MQHTELADITGTSQTNIPGASRYLTHEVDLLADSGTWSIRLMRRQPDASDYKAVTATLVLVAPASGTLSCGPGGDIVIDATEDLAGTLKVDVVSYGVEI